eukprot:6182871-Prymnesium_polylepis.1
MRPSALRAPPPRRHRPCSRSPSVHLYSAAPPALPLPGYLPTLRRRASLPYAPSPRRPPIARAAASRRARCAIGKAGCERRPSGLPLGRSPTGRASHGVDSRCACWIWHAPEGLMALMRSRFRSAQMETL